MLLDCQDQIWKTPRSGLAVSRRLDQKIPDQRVTYHKDKAQWMLEVSLPVIHGVNRDLVLLQQQKKKAEGGMKGSHTWCHRLTSWSFLLALWVPLLDCYGYSKCLLADKNPNYADCVGNEIANLTTAIQNLPNRTQWLNASQNMVIILEAGTFAHLPGLQELRLSRNRIENLEDGTFRGLGNLSFLDLSFNQLSYLAPSALIELQVLHVLDVSGNNLAHLQVWPWRSFLWLWKVGLSLNALTDFGVVARAFQGLPSLRDLDLSTNRISHLCSKENPVSLPALQHLNLRGNVLSVLDLTYCSLPGLQSLNLTRNDMSEVNVSSFLSTPSLMEVIFDENTLNISQLLGSPLSNLTALHWSSMRPALHQDSFMVCQVFQTMPRLTLLDIKHSKLSGPHLEVIGNCTNLTTLYLSTSPIVRLKQKELQPFRSLKTLFLNKCKLKELRNSTWATLVFLRTLILERNQLARLEDRLFQPLKNLHYLDLSKNYLTFLNHLAFYGQQNLRYLRFKGCKITTLTRDTFHYIRRLELLDVEDNSLSFIKAYTFSKLKCLKTLLLSGNRILTIQKNGFQGLSSLYHLTLSRNSIYKLSQDTFQPLKSLFSLDLSKNQLMTYNKFQSPNPFLHLKFLRELDLSSQMQTDPRNAPSRLFEGLKKLKKLHLNNNPSIFFHNLSFDPLTTLSELDISNIYTKREGSLHFGPEMFKGLGQLRCLNLDNSEVKDPPEDTFVHLTSLETLSLRYNGLRNISKNLMKNLFSLNYFDIYLNPLLCSCENYWFQNWSIFNQQVQIPLLGTYNCFGPGVTDINFTELDMTFCVFDIGLPLFISTFLLTTLTLVTSLLASKLRWTLRFGYYMLRAWWWGKPQRENKVYQYDAFVSCCSEDENWVVEKLLPHLEKQSPRRYKLCFSHRDFIPGHIYIDNVQNAIANSRKTLCIVSNRYLMSEWCQMEVELASSRIFYQQDDVLIVVFLEEIPNYRLSAYHRLRKLMRKNTYLSWPEEPAGQPLFWEKLKNLLDMAQSKEDIAQLCITRA
uniref:Toll-like receptor 13 n=1 Tax=Geotrypetes seraphini TaxID=260995 RepID=A0A6P8SH88_GEOSA|nr:toll-like receptor 13 [Geotrypetes seraphini]